MFGKVFAGLELMGDAVTVEIPAEWLKKITENMSVPPEDRFAAHLKLAKLPRNSSKTRIHHRCELSGRARGYYRKVKLSRIALRELSNFGQVPGMTKASW